MATWTRFYVHTDDSERVVEILLSLTDNLEVSKGSFPDHFHDTYLFDPELAPDHLVIGNTQPDWTTVTHNSFDELQDWGEEISRVLHTKVIITAAQSVSSFYYFALYEKGVKLREIKYCYSTDDSEPVNYGNKFDFEADEPGKKLAYADDERYFFGFDEIEDYCQHFGLTIQAAYDGIEWTILSSSVKQKTVQDFISTLNQKKKPWWKVW
jgi:hypothetical protein